MVARRFTLALAFVAALSLATASAAQTVTGPAGQVSPPASMLGRPFTKPQLPPGKMIVGDMVFDRDRMSRMPISSPRGAFDVPIYRWRLWEFGVIPVTFASNISETRKTVFYEACKLWAPAGVACIARLAEPVWVHVQAEDDGCWSEVGMGVTGPQGLNLADGCWSPSTVAHEIGHAFGMMHEHQRTDRDEYISVNYENVEPGYEDQFDKALSGINVTDYEFQSIMHYDRLAFGKSVGATTLSPKPGYEQTAVRMGLSSAPTQSDLVSMASVYRVQPLIYRTYPVVARPFTIGRDEALGAMSAIDTYYRAPAGLARSNGLSIDGSPDFLGLAAWFFDIYVNSRYAGYAEVESRFNVMASITQTDEWRTKHEGWTSAQPYVVPNRLPFDRSELLAVMLRLDAFYRAPEGLQRPNGLSLNGSPDFQGIATWVVDVYMGARLGGLVPDVAWQRVVAQIQQTDEWKSKH